MPDSLGLYGEFCSAALAQPSGSEGTKTLGRRLALRPPVATNSPLSSSSSGLRPSASPNVAQTASLPGGGTPLIRFFALTPVPLTPHADAWAASMTKEHLMNVNPPIQCTRYCEYHVKLSVILFFFLHQLVKNALIVEDRNNPIEEIGV